MKTTAAVRLTCEGHPGVMALAREALAGLGVWDVTAQAGRAQIVREAKRHESLFRGRGKLEESRVEVLSANLPRTCARQALAAVIEKAKLDIPGRGSAYTEEIGLRRGRTAALANPQGRRTAPDRFLLSDLIGITCIVLRGEGSAVARLALELGTAVPVITFGHGTGLRDRLGLLRVAIPAQKEMISIVAPEQDAYRIASIVADEAKLSQPGRGFLYLSRIGRGLLNTRIYAGVEHHAASMAQVVAAIDALRGGTSWRSRFAAEEGGRRHPPDTLTRGMVNLTVHCNEGRMGLIVRAAMDAGAGGATTMRVSHLDGDAARSAGILPVREKTSLVIRAETAPRVIEALEAAGLHDPETAGQIEESACPAAHTYARRPARAGR